MKRLSRQQAVAVAVALAVVAFFLFGGTIMGFFNQSNKPSVDTNQNQKKSLEIQDVTVGTGATAAPGDTITVHYVGTLTDGKVFDSSVDRGQPFTFTLGAGQVIKGWDEGLVGMKVGGERKLTIAPDYAYGAQAVGPIPPNSTLIFDVKLLNVQKGSAQ